MAVLPSQMIRTLAVKRGMLTPFVDKQSVAFGATYGLGPAGYDVTLAEDCWLWPGRFMLASTIERFDMPDNILAVVHDKSSWKRRGLSVGNTVIEPGWRGYLTLELKMDAWRVMRLRRGTPIAQIVFHHLLSSTEMPYTGRYQNQEAGPQKWREAA